MRDALATGTAVEAIEAALLVGLGSSRDIESGCLGVGSIIEFSREDEHINALNDKTGKAVVGAFSERVSESIAASVLDPDLDAEEAGRILLALRSGLKVAARGGATLAELRTTARLVIRPLTIAARDL